jgi:hypothetical protein
MYYGIKGKPGFLHSACLDEYCAKHARYDAHDRIISHPQVESMTPTPPRGKCILCGGWLAEVAISFNERAARALASKPADLRKRLQAARAVLNFDVARLFGKGRFDFHGERLVGENGLVLQWRVRLFPNRPVDYHNQQTNCGCVVLEKLVNDI